MPSVQTSRLSATDQAKHLLYLVEGLSQSLQDAIEQGERFLKLMDDDIDLPRFHVPIQDELRYLLKELSEDRDSAFDLDYLLKSTRELVALCELAESGRAATSLPGEIF